MDLSYAQEKLYDAVRLMASSKQDIRSRLEAAYASFHTLQVSPIPRADFAKRFNEIVDAMSSGSGTVRQALFAISDDETEELATKVFDLFYEVQRAYDGENGP